MPRSIHEQIAANKRLSIFYAFLIIVLMVRPQGILARG